MSTLVISNNKAILKPAKIIKKHSFFSPKGCSVQVLGIIILAIGAFFLQGIGVLIGGIIMLVLLRIGNRMAMKWYCGECNHLIQDKKAITCPACNARFN
ncbi:hypothetical protein ACFL0H_00130 [Thermodesulfobacteriota bacterium]